MCVFFLSPSYERKKSKNLFLIMPNHSRKSAVLHIDTGGPDPPIKCRKFSNFEFLLGHCMGIVRKNISTKFGEHPTNCSEIITKNVYFQFLSIDTRRCST